MSESYVIKLGTSVLTAGTDRLCKSRIVSLFQQLVQLRSEGKTVVLVSSGAVLAGWEQMGFFQRKHSIEEKQFLAAVGQSHLMYLYQSIADLFDIKVAQTLLTKDDFTHRQRYLNARTTLFHCLKHGVLPIVNENDVVTIDEIKLGDNDNLAAQVACLINADQLIICSDIEGLFTANPKTDPKAELIPVVNQITPQIEALAGGSGSAHGTGGMATKIQAAKIATRAGVGVRIVSGERSDILIKSTSAQDIGTYFAPHTKKQEAWKRWLLSKSQPESRVWIDAGAEEALLHKGKSLLSVGIAEVQGEFERGEIVHIYSKTKGQELGQGIVRYSAHDLRQIQGQQSHDIEGLLGYYFGSVMIHRNDLLII